MSMTNAMRRGFVAAGYVLLAFFLLGLVDVAFAQSAPFGMRGGAPDTGLVGWILAKQSEFYRAMSADIRAAKADGSAVVTLLGISFAYGIFHAAGPGHGKAVISSYIVANEETWRRGIVLSFASALLQALVAVAIVGVAVMLLGATRRGMDGATRVIEIGSYALIVFIGARLLWIKSRGFVAAWRAQRQSNALSAAVTEHRHDHAHRTDCGHDHSHGHHSHDHAHDHAHAHDHVRGPDCGHAHGPEPAELAGPGGWRRGLSAIVAVGLRPCSGAILVLVFAAAQGLFWAGIAATFVMGIGTAITVAAIATMAVSARALAAKFARSRPGTGALFLRGVEVAAAALVIVFGIALLTGYMASERMFGA